MDLELRWCKDQTVGTVMASLLAGAGLECADELLGWPPDVFAVTSSLLAESGGYRYVGAAGVKWPPSGTPSDWEAGMRAFGGAWSQATNADLPAPDHVTQLWSVIQAFRDHPIEAVVENARLAQAIIALHAVADEACAGLGSSTATLGEAYRAKANTILFRRGTLSRLPVSAIRVIPKFHTPQVGLTLRSMSHNVTADRSEVRVKWRMFGPDRDDEEMHLNVLLLPWPLLISPTDFSVTAKGGRVGTFRFDHTQGSPAVLLRQLIASAKRDHGAVDFVVLPEQAITASEAAAIQGQIGSDVKYLLAGVREPGRNYAYLAVQRGNGTWESLEQDKHHCWTLDKAQVAQYHLGGRLHTGSLWAEDIAMASRSVCFLTAQSSLAIAPLVCEDLARAGPAVDLVRAVGPNLVIALLLDGPQLGQRWSGRYASALADDPGSSVLTLSSLGMVERCRPPGMPSRRTIALWKDPVGGAQEIELEPGAKATLLSLCGHWKTEYSADIRSCGKNSAEWILAGVHQIQ